MLRLFAVYEIFYRCGRLGLCVRIYQNELYLHALGYYAFYVYRRGVARIQVLGKYVAARLGKSGKIRRQLQKNTVAFNASHGPGDRLTYRKQGGILLPCAEKLLLRKIQPSCFGVYTFDYRICITAAGEPVARVGYT